MTTPRADVKPKTTKEEFMAQAAEVLGVSPDQMEEMGEYVLPCRCPVPHCVGWLVLNVVLVNWAVAARYVNIDDLPPVMRQVLEN